MAPWLASGDWIQLLDSLAETQSAHCQVILPKSLSEKDRSVLLGEFARARSHVLTAVLLKNWHWTQVPHSVFALGHFDLRKAEAAWQQCRGADCNHPRISKLKEPAMLAQATAFFHRHLGSAGDVGVEDENVDTREFEAFCAEVRFTPTSDRQVEGDHARFHRRGGSAPRHTPHYLSLARRSGEMNELLLRCPEALPRLGSFLEKYPTALQICMALGISEESKAIVHLKAVRGSTTRLSRCGAYYSIPYLADAYSLFHMAAPKIEVIAEAQGRRTMEVGVCTDLATQNIVRKLALAHLRCYMQGSWDCVFSIRLQEGCVHRLRDLLTGGAHREEPARLDVERCLPNPALKITGTLQNMILFTPVCGGRPLHQMVRARVHGEEGLVASDVAISIVTILKRFQRQGTQYFLVSYDPSNLGASSAVQPLILAFDALPLSVLEDVRVWQDQHEVLVAMWMSDILGQDESREISAELVDATRMFMLAVLGAGKDGLRVDSDDAKAHNEDAVSLTLGRELVEVVGAFYTLTSLGQQGCMMGHVIAHPEKVLKVRATDLSEMTGWELVQSLFTDGWELNMAESSSQAKCPPYILTGAKKFYARAGIDGLSSAYMRALLSAHTRPGQRVEHFRTDRFYICLLSGQVFKKRHRKQRLDYSVWPEFAWLDDLDGSQALVGPGRGRRGMGAWWAERWWSPQRNSRRGWACS